MSSIEVSCGGKVHTVQVNDNETLLAALRKAGFSVPAACGGRGKCGKCRVKINGVQRLACKVIPTDGDTVELPEAAAGAILTDTVSIAAPKTAQSGIAAAVDLGTTTVAVRIYDLENAAELGTLSAWNAQAAYGGDVISRIRYTMDEPDGLHELSALVRRQTEELILDALADCGRDKAELRSVFLAGNTVMQHIFAGLPVRSIATAPFKPETLFEAPTGDTLLGAELSYAPCVAGYVGGDITAGLLASKLCSAGGSSLFLDIGTNGEMALVSGGRVSCCAVASGPAFEGAGISCGMPALSGAVSHVRYDRGFLYDVIGAVEPVGICGSGLIDLAATLLKLGCIDNGGRLLPPELAPGSLRRYIRPDGQGNGVFHLTETVYLTAADVRSLQLAKAAVAGGVEVLLARHGIKAGDLSRVCLAGGFGNYIDPKSAMTLGMLPEISPERLHCLGNTSLAGASMAAVDPECRRELRSCAEKCEYIELSGLREFTEAFTDNMTFDITED
ncbi:MAG: ASKHA domain-containing protein [Oscillospiraceae bacterium]|nr:ASKHA domain-containing protein [Oscillospiraceae bacterium]